MIPILYSKTETAFTSNGIGRLSDASRCEVTEERNGIFEMEIEYPMTGVHFKDIQPDCYIKTICNAKKDYQLFRVYSITKPINGRCTIYAEHVSYQMLHIPLMPFSAAGAAAVMAAIPQNVLGDCPFTFWTDIVSERRYNLNYPKSLRGALQGDQWSILQNYGGDYEWDNWTVRLWSQRGQDKGVILRYGKNITDLKQEENIQNTYTGIVPYWYGTEGEEQTLVMLPEQVLYAPTAQSYPYSRILAVDFTEQMETQPTIEELRAQGNYYITKNEIGYPSVSISLDFVDLSQTVEYQDLAVETLNICDVITVEFEELGVSKKARITRTKYDVLTERYTDLYIGESYHSLASIIADQKVATGETIVSTRDKIQSALDEATAVINGDIEGSSMKTITDQYGNPRGLIIMDTYNESTAVNCIRINNNGIGFSTNGPNGPYNSAWLINGTFDASQINVVNLSGGTITSGTITSTQLSTAVNNSISSAQSAANTAQSTANGANGREQIIYKSAATGTTSMAGKTTWEDNATGRQGDWTTRRPAYNRDTPVLFVATQRQTVQQMANGTACTCTTPVIDQTTTVIDGGNIITNSITASQIASNAVTADKINAGAVTTAKLDSEAVTAAKIKSGTITATQIASDAVTADKIYAGAVTAAKIATDAIESDKIKANAITAGKINAGAITTEKLDSEAVTAAKIKTGTITATQIAGTTITGDKIVGHTINVDKLTGTISSNNWSLNFQNGTFTIGNISADNINAGHLSASYIQGGTLTLGGANNGNGTLVVKNASDATLISADNNGLMSTGLANTDTENTRAIISGGKITFQAYTGTLSSSTNAWRDSLVIQSYKTSAIQNSINYMKAVGILDLEGLSITARWGSTIGTTSPEILLQNSEMYLRNFGRIRTSHATGGGWHKGRDNAVLESGSYGTSSMFFPICSMKTSAGSWAIGTLAPSAEELYFVYVTDANYRSDTNQTTRIWFRADGTSNIGADKDGAGNTITSTYVKKAGDTMAGDLNISKSSATASIVQLTNSLGGLKLQVSADEQVTRGLYDTKNSTWMMYRQGTSNNLYLSSDVCVTAKNRGYFLVDGGDGRYAGIFDNGSNLWIGATQTNSVRHHRGAVYISTGWNATAGAGYDTINIVVPNAQTPTASSTYKAIHSGNFASRFKTVHKTPSATPSIGANSSGDVTISLTESGYTFMGIVGFTTKSSYVYPVVMRAGLGATGNITITLRNTGSSTYTSKPEFTCLYVKTDGSS